MSGPGNIFHQIITGTQAQYNFLKAKRIATTNSPHCPHCPLCLAALSILPSTALRLELMQ